MKITTARSRSRFTLRALSTIAALATAVALTSCSSSSGAGSADSGEGSEVTFLLDSLGATWVPNSASFSSFQGNVFDQIYDKLVYVDDQGKVSPWIAESWENNADYTQFTLHLKDGVTFSDGEKLDAAAVVANLDYWAKGQADKGIPPIGLFPKTYASSTVVDESTVQVDFSAPTLGFIPVLGYAASALVRTAGPGRHDRGSGRPEQELRLRTVRGEVVEGRRLRRPGQAG